MRYIKELEGLRGLMALWVVFGHSLAALPIINKHLPPTALNSYAVDVFIMLSGFVIFFMIDNKRQPYLQYIVQRFFRIFPLYILVLVISIILIIFARDVFLLFPEAHATTRRIILVDEYLKHPTAHLLAHLTLLQGVIPDFLLKDSSYTIVGQAWSISVEWQFYLLAPLLFFLASNLRLKRMILFVFFITMFMFLLSLYFGGGFLGNNLSPFLIGFLSFFFYKNSEKITFSMLQYVIVVAILSFAIFLRKDSIPYIIWCVVLGFIMIYHKTNESNFVVRFLDNKSVLFLGKISYSIYLVHMIVLVFVLYLSYLFNMNGIVIYFFVIPATVLSTISLSTVTYYFVEQPFIKMGKKLSTRFKCLG
ncbi:TPA: acyltransferase [Klebsiella aerogenes]|uniref:acyltransferase family protein n=1 Tax=Klebsiella aerogenes TaxID=548 RepID=UPI000F7ED437|nr:acyltransferase [Klebsiella aerogenes]RSW87444.1 acyltransferase [Klebsiella aerogenes]HBS6040819.1 acyltransferase [Klebsiella aerogenes]